MSKTISLLKGKAVIEGKFSDLEEKLLIEKYKKYWSSGEHSLSRLPF
jgi:hypothetical protein